MASGMLLAVMLQLVLLVSQMLPAAQSLSFELHKDHTKCMNEEIHSGVLTLADYHVTDPKDPEKPAQHKIYARVTDPQGYTVHFAENVDRGQFGFKSEETGVYVACFWMEGVTEKEAVVSVDLDWKTGVAAKDWGNIAKREQIDGMELELRKLEDLVDSVHDEILYLREKEQEMRLFNEKTTKAVNVLTVTCLFLCLIVAAVQFWYLKGFFERKKLL